MKKSKKTPMTAAEKKRLLKAGTEALAVAKHDVSFKLRLNIVLDRAVKNEDDRALLRQAGLLD